MSRLEIVGYPTPGKGKAKLLLDAFCGGAGGTVVDRIPDKLLPGAAAFYGVTDATKHLFYQCLAEKRPYYYMDNAYFDKTREVYFRITKNRLQHEGYMAESDGKRWDALGITIQPPRATTGKHILLCPQSDPFMRICVRYPGADTTPGKWVEDTIAELRKYTKRELRVRPWHNDKKSWYKGLPADLAGCHALVTYSSASAISAMLAGVPAFVTAEDSICAQLCGRPLSEIEHPYLPDHQTLDRWAMVVADNQWTVDEMRRGLPIKYYDSFIPEYMKKKTSADMRSK